jgi:hypothetical protein
LPSLLPSSSFSELVSVKALSSQANPEGQPTFPEYTLFLTTDMLLSFFWFSHPDMTFQIQPQ